MDADDEMCVDVGDFTEVCELEDCELPLDADDDSMTIVLCRPSLS
jgi:hypothetical protein